MVEMPWDAEKIKSELEENGYAVVEGVLTEGECQQFRKEYEGWLQQFPPNDWPYHQHSIIQHYRIGHMNCTWRLRLAAKPVFAALWGTEKLFTSIDGVAIGRPPEGGTTRFAEEGEHWLHCDQGAVRKGVHAYQGAVYLEECSEDDWCLEVVKKSHLYHEKFFQRHRFAAIRSCNDYCRLKSAEISWYSKMDPDCQVHRVPVPKGGMVLWDSRTIHANARPIKGRQNPDRWRYVAFVCMTPAIWASQEDIESKAKAYDECLMTSHWASQGVGFFREKPRSLLGPSLELPAVKELPDIAKTKDVQNLMGVNPYDFEDGLPNGPPAPEWVSEREVLGTSWNTGGVFKRCALM